VWNRSRGGDMGRGKVKEAQRGRDTVEQIQGKRRKKESKKEMHSSGTLLPHNVLSHLLLLIITSFAQ